LSAEGTIRDDIAALARKHGFDTFGIAPAGSDPTRSANLREWLAEGMEGEMGWMAREPEKRATPQALWPEAKSVIMLGANYGVEGDPLVSLGARSRATLALYAIRRDYHDVIKSRLKAFARDLVVTAGGAVKVFVDTAPVMEKPLAASAGLGWQGKHTVLVSRSHGNWLFLGAVFSTLAIPPDEPEPDHCGRCRRCLDICPTDAFPAPYRLDPRRCIAYLTIEHKGTIPRDLRGRFGNRVFGCDDCLEVCPWNRFARLGRLMQSHARADLAEPELVALLALDEAAFKAQFAGTSLWRSKRRGLLRNACVALGNVGDASTIPALETAARDPEPLIAEHARWALREVQRRVGGGGPGAQERGMPEPERGG
jgi:epoxyqueuosine reductase